MRLPIIMIMAVGLAACSPAPIRTVISPGPAADPSAAGIDGRSEADTPHELAPLEQIPASRGDKAPASAYGDVWTRIRDNLKLERHVELRNVQDKLAWYKRNQEYLDRVVERARPYLFYIVEELQRRNMPLDIALLPIVESAYHPFAHSPSRASGIWQFIPSTGKRYGLKQNWWYDGRRDIVAATGAALDYLQKLHSEFGGDWLLALAAYNTGELNVVRAVGRNRSAGKPIDFWNLNLPRETRGYVPSLLAVAELIAEPARHGVHWQPVPDRRYFERVDLDGQIDLATAAALADISMDELYTLNPGFNQWATDPDGPHYLLLPVARAGQFRAGLATLPETERVSWMRHEVKPSETLLAIAGRYRTSVDALKQSNGLRGDLIRPGQSLLIPGAKQPPNHYTLSADGRRLQNLKNAPEGEQYVYTVRRGDTLWDISRQYGVSVNDLLIWNGLSPRVILRPGQKLQLSLAGGAAVSVAALANGDSITVDMESPPQETVSYTVRKGDSLWLISRRFGVSIVQLQTWNKLAQGSVLRPGQVLTVYRAEQVAQGA